MGEFSGLYHDDETGVVISTHSMMRTFRRCPKQAEYKYVERLKPRILGRPLRLGTWMHALQEAVAKGESWQDKHAELTKEWNKLLDEEKEDIGNLPRDCERLMRSYLWHYKADEWIYHEAEFTLETTFPDGSIYRAKIDNLVENQFGLWIVDHKWHKILPDLSYRILDSQSALYIWAAIRNKIPVQGHIWDYGRSKPPTELEFTKTTGKISRWNTVDTDYPTAARFFKEHFDGKVPKEYQAKMNYLKSLRYEQGMPQGSNFFKRSIIEKSPDMLKRVAQEGYHTARRMHEYPFDRPEIVERVPDRSCKFMCSFTDLCTAELFTGKRPINWKSKYEVGDPMDYYYDDETPDKDGE